MSFQPASIWQLCGINREHKNVLIEMVDQGDRFLISPIKVTTLSTSSDWYLIYKNKINNDQLIINYYNEIGWRIYL